MVAFPDLPPLEPHSPVPLYRQLYAFIRDAIKLGSLRTGDRIPPTREMAHLAGVNRATVAAAYELLESDGLIQGHVGRGSFVLQPPVARAPLTPTVISFATSRPSADLFPLTEFRQTVQEVLDSAHLTSLLQLGSPSGFPPLKAALLPPSSAEILITNGCQQALDLIARTMAAPGDTVLVEDPVYGGLKNAFASARVRLAGLPDLHRNPEASVALIERERPRLVVVTPDFQNPTGLTLSADTRRALGLATARAGVPLVEIDLYRDLRYSGVSIPTIQELVPEAQVLLLRSFSKIAFPGLRVGWISGPRPLLARLTETKQWTDLHTDQFSQAVLLRFLESKRLEKHRQRVVQSGAACLKAALEACQRELPRGSEFTRPVGGMNLWVTLPGPIDSAAMLTRAQREGVTYLPGSYFAVERPQTSSLRLSFAGLPPGAIREGIAMLGRVATAELSRSRAQQYEPAAMAMV